MFQFWATHAKIFARVGRAVSFVVLGGDSRSFGQRSGQDIKLKGDDHLRKCVWCLIECVCKDATIVVLLSVIMYCALCIMHYVLCICIMHYALCIMHYALCIMHYALCIMYYVLCIMYHKWYVICHKLFVICYILYTAFLHALHTYH